MGPLKGKRIIEFSAIGPGPFACMMLADMGAEVITIDRKAAEIKMPQQDPTLRNRKSIALNLKSPQGIDAAIDLCASADAVVEGFRPGVMERLGLGPDILMDKNPKLVVGRMTGWGQEGPLANTVGHDINYISINGVLEKIGRRGQKPTPPLNLVGDYGGGGMMLAFGVVCAMLEAQASGKGQVVDAAMVDGSAALMNYIWSFEVNDFYKPYSQRDNQIFGGNTHFYNTYETSDGKYISVGPLEAHFYVELIAILNTDVEFFEKEWLGSPDANLDNFAELEQKMGDIFIQKTRDEWVKVFENSNACFAPVLNFEEAQQHPHIKARNTYIELEGITQAAPTPRFSRTEADFPKRPRIAGEDSKEIMSDVLNYSQDKIDALINDGAAEQA